jgi:hypothetical protein
LTNLLLAPLSQAFLTWNAYTGELGLLSGRRISWRICELSGDEQRREGYGILSAKNGTACGTCEDRIVTQEPATLLKDLAPFGTVVVSVVVAFGSALWIVFTYVRSQRDLVAARLIESRGPFLELRLKLYTRRHS